MAGGVCIAESPWHGQVALGARGEPQRVGFRRLQHMHALRDNPWSRHFPHSP